MKRNRYSILLTLLTCLSLLVSLCGGILLNDRASAAPRDSSQKQAPHRKVASDLRERMQRSDGGDKVDVILQLNGEMSFGLNALLSSSGVKVKKHFTNFASHAVQLPPSIVDSLENFPEVDYVSVDSEVKALGGHVAHTTGADDARTYAPTGSSFDGAGVGIAVVDSGIYASHVSFLDSVTNTSRIVKSVDFTGEGRTDDPYGHGTHVAAAAAGNGMISNGKFIGIAPRASIVN